MDVSKQGATFVVLMLRIRDTTKWSVRLPISTHQWHLHWAHTSHAYQAALFSPCVCLLCFRCILEGLSRSAVGGRPIPCPIHATVFSGWFVVCCASSIRSIESDPFSSSTPCFAFFYITMDAMIGKFLLSRLEKYFQLFFKNFSHDDFKLEISGTESTTTLYNMGMY